MAKCDLFGHASYAGHVINLYSKCCHFFYIRHISLQSSRYLANSKHMNQLHFNCFQLYVYQYITLIHASVTLVLLYLNDGPTATSKSNTTTTRRGPAFCSRPDLQPFLSNVIQHDYVGLFVSESRDRPPSINQTLY